MNDKYVGLENRNLRKIRLSLIKLVTTKGFLYFVYILEGAIEIITFLQYTHTQILVSLCPEQCVIEGVEDENGIRQVAMESM